MEHRRAIVSWLAAGLLGCGGGGGSPATPTQRDDGRASFALQGAGLDGTKSYSNAGGNLIFCRREDPFPDTIWIRLAEQRAGDGEQGPHIDIDLCNFSGTSTYGTVHAVGGPRACNQGQTFAIWWHDSPSNVFVSRPTSTGCSVSVTRTGNTIEGSFACQDLTPFTGSGSPTLDVASGSFRCSLQG
jgi:hypothetical protein